MKKKDKESRSTLKIKEPKEKIYLQEKNVIVNCNVFNWRFMNYIRAFISFDVNTQ